MLLPTFMVEICYLLGCLQSAALNRLEHRQTHIHHSGSGGERACGKQNTWCELIMEGSLQKTGIVPAIRRAVLLTAFYSLLPDFVHHSFLASQDASHYRVAQTAHNKGRDGKGDTFLQDAHRSDRWLLCEELALF